MVNIVIIGAGGVGCAVARHLSRYQNLSIIVLEKESDVAAETSGRNSAVVHAGFNNKPGSLIFNRFKYKKIYRRIVALIKKNLALIV